MKGWQLFSALVFFFFLLLFYTLIFAVRNLNHMSLVSTGVADKGLTLSVYIDSYSTTAPKFSFLCFSLLLTNFSELE